MAHRFLFFFALLGCVAKSYGELPIQACDSNEPCQFNEIEADQNIQTLKHQLITQTLLKILKEQPETIEYWIGNRFYIDPMRMFVTPQGIFAYDEHSLVLIPSLAMDEFGPFLLCDNAQVNAEAQKHYDSAGRNFWKGVAHSAAAGAYIEIPPLAIFEGYQAVEAFKQSAAEYFEALKLDGALLPGLVVPETGGTSP